MSDRDDPNYEWVINLINQTQEEIIEKLLYLRGQVETLTEKNVELAEDLSNKNKINNRLSGREEDLLRALKPLIELGEEKLKTSWNRHDWEIVRTAQYILEDV
jgi:hypothetical protein